jgi:hypothetical protein
MLGLEHSRHGVRPEPGEGQQPMPERTILTERPLLNDHYRTIITEQSRFHPGAGSSIGFKVSPSALQERSRN